MASVKKEAKKLKYFDPQNDPEYKLWMNVIEKFIKLNPETSQNSMLGKSDNFKDYSIFEIRRSI